MGRVSGVTHSPLQKALTALSLPQDDQFRLPYNLEVRPSSEFSYEAAKNKLVNLKIGSETGPQVTFVVPGDVLAADEHDGDGGESSGRQGRLLRLSCWIDVESRLTVSYAASIQPHLTHQGWVRWCRPVLPATEEGHCVSSW